MINRFLLGIFATSITCCATASQPEISGYYLSGPDASLGSPEYYATLNNLERLADNIESTNSSNFNKLILSFVQPSLKFYNPSIESLQCTGLFGTYCDSEPSQIDIALEIENFFRLQNVIQRLKNRGVETYLALGGWNFSCDPEYYDITTGKQNACGPEGAQYDTFPNPLSDHPRFEHPYTVAEAKESYAKVVHLAAQLGASGIDIDYEEFWHADMNAFEWKITPDTAPPSTGIEYISTNNLIDAGKGGYIYNSDGQLIGDQGLPRVMPETVDKFAAIIRELKSSIERIAPDLKLSMAAPAAGAIPNMSANWGTNAQTVSTYGGAWWGGNLYGLIYNTALMYPQEIDALTSIGIMSYDLSETDCDTSDGGAVEGSFIPCDLAGQEKFYYGTFITWLKSGAHSLVADGQGSPEHAIIKGAPSYAQNSIQPKKLLIAPTINVGFEVGQPATGSLVLQHDALEEILNHVAKGGKTGMIMWDLFKDMRFDQNNWQASWATPQEVLKRSCEIMQLSGDEYDCNTQILTPPLQH